MKHDKILVPYDGSEGAKNAMKYAVRILEDAPDAKIILFTSLAGAKDIDKLVGTGREGTGFVEDSVREHFEKARAKSTNGALESMKADVEELAPDAKDSFECVVEFNPSPVQGIIEAADKYGVDAIYMGCRGVSAIAGMLGSVSFGVIRSANVPVTVVK
jgi:nucleotide-binding universal stress UspA family protein